MSFLTIYSGMVCLPFAQSGIAVRASRMTTTTASANAATPISTAVFLPNRFCDARAISAAAATQTAAAASAMPSSVHSQDSS